jgi:hypothetical protein
LPQLAKLSGNRDGITTFGLTAGVHSGLELLVEADSLSLGGGAVIDRVDGLLDAGNLSFGGCTGEVTKGAARGRFEGAARGRIEGAARGRIDAVPVITAELGFHFGTTLSKLVSRCSTSNSPSSKKKSPGTPNSPRRNCASLILVMYSLAPSWNFARTAAVHSEPWTNVRVASRLLVIGTT